MDTETITTIINGAISFLALILSILLKRKAVKTKTPEEIAEEANQKAQKYIDKQFKKYKINNDGVTKSEITKSDITNYTENI